MSRRQERRTLDEICVELHTTALEFVEDVRDNIFTKDSEYADLEIVRWFIKRMVPAHLMEQCRKHILPWNEHIRTRNTDFFLKNKAIFQGLPEDKWEYFSAPWKPGNKRLSDDNKEIMFAYFDTIIELIEEHEKLK